MMLNTLQYAHGHCCRYGLSCPLVDHVIILSQVYNVCHGPCRVICDVCNVCDLIYELVFFVRVLLCAYSIYKMVMKVCKKRQKRKEKLS